jgi:hypothetical protein
MGVCHACRCTDERWVRPDLWVHGQSTTVSDDAHVKSNARMLIMGDYSLALVSWHAPFIQSTNLTIDPEYVLGPLDGQPAAFAMS